MKGEMKMFQKGEKKDITDLIQDMLEGYNKTQTSMHEIDNIATQSRMLANTAARELGRMGGMAGGFQIITQEIKNFSEANRTTNQKNMKNVEALNTEINSMLGVRTADVAYDLIDKIDRNLAERYCNVQVWCTFEAIIRYAKEDTPHRKEDVMHLLKSLHKIYAVYHDIFMVDRNGTIVAAAEREEYIGRDVSQKDWFLAAKEQENVVVSDLHYSKVIDDYVVSYTNRIVDEDGTFLGVITTRFNWENILAMIDETKIGKKGEVYLINKDGMVIGARDRGLIFRKNMLLECQGAQTILAGEVKENYGYAIEMNEQAQLTRILGYAKTKGYNSYKGQEWAVLALENIR